LTSLEQLVERKHQITEIPMDPESENISKLRKAFAVSRGKAVLLM
jgi:hypothetical protein